MRYVAIVTKEGRRTLAEFRDCPGCQTFAEAGERLEDAAREALTGWLEAQLVTGRPVPPPSKRGRARAGEETLAIEVPSRLAVRLCLRSARQAAGLTQGALAERAGVSQQAIAKLEHPDANPTVETIEKVAHALGMRLELTISA